MKILTYFKLIAIQRRLILNISLSLCLINIQMNVIQKHRVKMQNQILSLRKLMKQYDHCFYDSEN